ncbi:MAG TPA: nuclear transport factor 2 family protein [Rhizorhapis sp.]
MDERTEKNREIALRLVKAVGSGDMPVVESLVHPDLDWWLNGMGHLDHDAFIASLHMLHSAKSGGFTVVTSTAEADRVVIEMVGHFEYEDGRVYDNNYCELMTIKDGLVYKVHAFFDIAAAEKAFAAMLN